MLRNESGTLPHPTCVLSQSSVTETDRSQLVNKLIAVHQFLALRDETLFLTMNLADRYLSICQLQNPDELSLTIATALHISCKYEEIYPPCGREILRHLAPTF